MLSVLPQITRADVPTLTLSLGLLCIDGQGCHFRLNLGEAGRGVASLLIFPCGMQVSKVAISSHTLHLAVQRHWLFSREM